MSSSELISIVTAFLLLDKPGLLVDRGIELGGGTRRSSACAFGRVSTLPSRIYMVSY